MRRRDVLVNKAILCIETCAQKAASDNFFTLTSMELEEAGVKLEDQLEVLGSLSRTYDAIKFSSEWPYKDAEQLPEEVTKSLLSHAKITQTHPQYLIYKYLSQKNYIVSTLPQFAIYAKRAKSNLPIKFDDIDRTNAKYSAVITLQGNQLFIELRAGIRGPLGPPLRYGGTPYNFIHYLFAHPFQTINIHDIREQVEGCATKQDLTELVRHCHFDKFLKSIFFERTTKTQVRFTPWRDLKSHEISDYIDAVDKLRAQNAKYRSKES